LPALVSPHFQANDGRDFEEIQRPYQFQALNKDEQHTSPSGVQIQKRSSELFFASDFAEFLRSC